MPILIMGLIVGAVVLAPCIEVWSYMFSIQSGLAAFITMMMYFILPTTLITIIEGDAGREWAESLGESGQLCVLGVWFGLHSVIWLLVSPDKPYKTFWFWDLATFILLMGVTFPLFGLALHVLRVVEFGNVGQVRHAPSPPQPRQSQQHLIRSSHDDDDFHYNPDRFR